MTPDCRSPFTEDQRAMLKSLCKLQPKGKEYVASPNRMLEAYTKQLKDNYPEMFQDAVSMRQRVFVDEPRSCSYERAIRSYAESPYKVRHV